MIQSQKINDTLLTKLLGNLGIYHAKFGLAVYNTNAKDTHTHTGAASSIPARYHTFVEIDHEIISTVILLLPLIYSRRVVVSYKRKYVHKLLVNRLLKPVQEKVWLSELTVPQ